jgi:uncharacterized radical SAM protein YgiQ
MYNLNCKLPPCTTKCRKLSCLHPKICPNLKTNHNALIQIYKKARNIPGIKKVLIASGVRYDLALKSPPYIKELISHHVGGYLKIAPEHITDNVLEIMCKPGIDIYTEFSKLFTKYSCAANKEQYLIPYFIAAHPGTRDEDMLELALWLKTNNFRLEKVQNFLPTPLTLATTMYHTGFNPLKDTISSSSKVYIPKGAKQRRLHKAFLRYHEPKNWPLLRQALKQLGRNDLIGHKKNCLVPPN